MLGNVPISPSNEHFFHVSQFQEVKNNNAPIFKGGLNSRFYEFFTVRYSENNNYILVKSP